MTSMGVDLSVAKSLILARRDLAPNGCWHYTGSINSGGYGSLKIGSVTRSVHRLSYAIFVELPPDRHDVGHLCHDADKECPGGVGDLHRRCFNPKHLAPQTHSTNMVAGRNVKRALTHCPSGHPYSGANLGVSICRGRPARYCKACKAMRALAYYYDNKVSR